MAQLKNGTSIGGYLAYHSGNITAAQLQGPIGSQGTQGTQGRQGTIGNTFPGVDQILGDMLTGRPKEITGVMRMGNGGYTHTTGVEVTCLQGTQTLGVQDMAIQETTKDRVMVSRMIRTFVMEIKHVSLWIRFTKAVHHAQGIYFLSMFYKVM